MSIDDKIPKGMKPSPFLDDKKYIAKASKYSFARVNPFPTVMNGHLLICPNDISKVTPFHMTEKELQDCAKLIQESLGVIRISQPIEKRAQGFTIGWNILPAGGQSIAHSHAHIIPRKEGDNITADGREVPIRGGIARVLPLQDSFYNEIERILRIEEIDSKIISENELSKALIPPYPITKNHFIILPKRDVIDFEELTAEEITSMVLLSKSLLKEFHGLDAENSSDRGLGANIGWNLDEVSGQIYNSSAVLDVIPRTFGDVEKARGGIAKIIPQAATDYYAGKQSGVKILQGKAVTNQAELGDERNRYFSELTARMQRLWPKSLGVSIAP